MESSARARASSVHCSSFPGPEPQEAQTTMYHVLWELVHVFFEQPGILGPAVVR